MNAALLVTVRKHLLQVMAGRVYPEEDPLVTMR